MRKLLAAIGRFLTELRRRKVYQVALAYVVVGFMVIEAADLTLVRLGLPPWTVTLVVVLVGLGFPIAIVLAWALEVTPEGVRVEGDEEDSPRETVRPASSPRDLWIGASVLVLLLFGAWWMWGGPSGDGTDGPGPAEPAVRDTVGPPRIAVLPFENIAPDSASAYFARGIHEEVLNQLSTVSGLEVVSRTSVMEYQQTDMQVPEISRDLGGVSALLEGTVRRAGDQLRITTQLIEAPADEHLWSETYDRRLAVEEIFRIQSDIAEKITTALESRLTEEERRRIEDAPTSNYAAYDAYLKGLDAVSEFYGSQNPAQLDQAIAHFREAIRRDPSLAEAQARLADGYRLRHSRTTDRRWLDSANAALDRARALDRQVPQIHWVQGFLYAGDRDSSAAAAFRRALDLQPSSAIACSGLSTVRAYQGRLAESVRWAHRAYRLEPGGIFRHAEMGGRLMEIGMLKAAKSWFEAALASNRDYLMAVRGLAQTQILTDPEQALRTMKSFLDRHPGHPDALAFAARSALAARRPDQAKSYLERLPEARRQFNQEGPTNRPAEAGLFPVERLLLGLTELRSGTPGRGRRLVRKALGSWSAGSNPWWVDSHLWRARGLAVLDREGEALTQLRQAVEDGEVVYQKLEVFSVFEELRTDPQFRKHIEQMKEKQVGFQEEVRKMEIDLYPPGIPSDSVRTPPQADA